MVRRVYFAFHYQNDIWRVNQIRKAHIVEGVAAAGFQDGSLWEEAKRKGHAAIKKLINDGLVGTTVTAVLIGSQTAGREYIDYEIRESARRGNGLIGIYIHNLANQYGLTDFQGANPFPSLGIYGVPVYDWKMHNGYGNFGMWVMGAYLRAQAA